MWPWGHLALGYLCYSLWTRARTRRPPGARGVVILAVFTQFPDAIDKPLVTVGVLPEGRALAHSLLFAVPFCLLVVSLTLQDHDRTAVVVGYGTHLFGDSLPSLLVGDWSGLSFLLWPVFPPPNYPIGSFAGHYRQLLAQIDTLEWGSLLHWESYFVVQLWIAGFVLLLWVYDGMPPLAWQESPPENG